MSDDIICKHGPPIDCQQGTDSDFVIVFNDGEYLIVKDSSYSRARVQASKIRYDAGASTHRELGIVEGLSSKLTFNYRQGVKPEDFSF